MRLLYATDRRPDAYLIKALREVGHVVEPAGEPADGVVMAADGGYQAVLLDWSSLSTRCIGRFAAAAARALVVVIAEQGDEGERAGALRAGADACFIRPLPFIEFEARLEALARLMQRIQPANDPASAAMLVAERAVRLNGHAISLSAREFQVMDYLIAHAGEVIGLERLQLQVWGEASEPRPEMVRTCVSRLRRKLAACGAGEVLASVPGHGYAFTFP